MKAKKIIAIILLVLGSCALLFGGFFYGREFISTRGIEKLNADKNYNNQVVAINGGLVSEELAFDEELQTGCNSAILLRDVKMLQWVNDEKGTRLALANYPVESFTVDNATYTNPEFYKDLPRLVNHGILKAGNVSLDNSVLDLLANTSFVQKTQVTDINETSGFKFKLTPYNGSYVTASDEWSIGEVKVDLYEIADESLNNVTIVGKVNNNILADATILQGALTISEIQSILLKDYTLYLLIAGAGLVLILIGVILLIVNKSKKKKNKEEVKVEPVVNSQMYDASQQQQVQPQQFQQPQQPQNNQTYFNNNNQQNQ